MSAHAQAKSGPRRPAGRRRRLGQPCLLAVPVVAIALAGMTATTAPDDVGDTRAALQKWVETRQIISKERRDWALGQEVLNERIDLVMREIDSLHDRIGEAEKNIAEADKTRVDLVNENDTLKATSEALGVTLVTLEKRTRDLLKRLPDPIRDRVQPLSQRLPDDSGETKLSLAERFQNVVGILNEVNRFDGEITVANEVRALPDGTSAEVTALYVGIGHGYYVGANGQVAGVGAPGADDWTWTPANESAEQIAAVIAILKNEQVASFVRLPIEIK